MGYQRHSLLPRLLPSYRTILHGHRLENQSALMDRQIRTPLTMSYSINEKIWYQKNREFEPERSNFIMQKGYNTALIVEKGNNVLAHVHQIRSRQDYKGDIRLSLEASPAQTL